MLMIRGTSPASDESELSSGKTAREDDMTEVTKTSLVHRVAILPVGKPPDIQKYFNPGLVEY